MGGHTQRSGPCFSSDHKKRFLSRFRAHLGIRKCTAKLRKEWTILDIIETRNKWRTSFNKYIKNKWQKVVYNNNTSGSEKKPFQHEDLCEAIWVHRPSTTPLNVVSSMKGGCCAGAADAPYCDILSHCIMSNLPNYFVTLITVQCA